MDWKGIKNIFRKLWSKRFFGKVQKSGEGRVDDGHLSYFVITVLARHPVVDHRQKIHQFDFVLLIQNVALEMRNNYASHTVYTVPEP